MTARCAYYQGVCNTIVQLLRVPDSGLIVSWQPSEGAPIDLHR
ncbi:MAG: hypothetical protein ABSE51_10460 [Terracidiphilus sp.]